MEAARQLSQRLADDRAVTAPHVAAPRGFQHRRSAGEALASLLTWDCVRVSKILETTHCAVLYALLGAAFGLVVDLGLRRLYPARDGEDLKSWRDFGLTVAVVVLQVVASAVLVIFIRKLAALVPFFFNLCPSRYLEGYHVQEIEGEIAVALVYVGVQTTLVEQLQRLNRFLASKL